MAMTPGTAVDRNDRRTAVRRLLPWLRWGAVAVLVAMLVLDLAFPPPLPRASGSTTVVTAADGTPLRAFADEDGVWRYPADPARVSPL